MKKINRYISLLMCIPVSITGFIPNSPEWLLYLRVFLLGIQNVGTCKLCLPGDKRRIK